MIHYNSTEGKKWFEKIKLRPIVSNKRENTLLCMTMLWVMDGTGIWRSTQRNRKRYTRFSWLLLRSSHMVNIYICSNYTVHKQITVNTYGHVYMMHNY